MRIPVQVPTRSNLSLIIMCYGNTRSSSEARETAGFATQLIAAAPGQCSHNPPGCRPCESVATLRHELNLPTGYII